MAEAEAGSASELVVRGQIEVAGFALVALPPLDVGLTQTGASMGITMRMIGVRASDFAATVLAAIGAELEEPVHTLVAIPSADPRFAVALSSIVTLLGERAHLVTAAAYAVVLARAPPMIRSTVLAMNTMRVALTIDTMSSMSSFLKKILIEEAAVGKMRAVTSNALVRLVRGTGSPRPVVVEGQALVAVSALRVVLATAYQSILSVHT